MGRITALILVLALLLCGCDVNETLYDKPVDFYYLTTASDFTAGSSYIVPETREGEGLGDNLEQILSSYIAGPIDPQQYRSPFPASVKLYRAVMKGNTLEVTLTRSFGTLTDMELTLACASLTLTCLGLTEAQTVRIYAHGTTINGNEFIEMDAASLLLFENGVPEE